MILICGPCVIESYELLDEVMYRLIEINKHFDFYFKASCIKDNRTKLTNFRGVGFELGIKYLTKIKNKYNVKITTDFHSEEQIEKYSNYVDLIQIPAFLARQSSLLVAASKTNKKLHVKKPQLLGCDECDQISNKVDESNIILCDRGTSFGYKHVMFDPRHIQFMKKHYSSDSIVDITHPNKHWNDYSYAFSIGESAIISGADGVFLETHPRPEKALCDAETMIPLNEVNSYLINLKKIYDFRKKL